MAIDVVADDSPELRASYEACAAEVREFLPPLWAAVEVLPAAIRPPLHALHAFASRSDRIADEGEATERVRRFAQWRSDALAELRSGRSEHPLRRALVDTARRWDMDYALFEEFLDTLRADCASPPVYETFADLRRYLRGVSGTIAELWAPLLGVRVSAELSVVGELFQLVDVFEDLPIDLDAGRCYLPRADLRRLGLEIADLRGGESRDALDELIAVQLGYGRDLLDQALPVIEMVEAEYRPYLQTAILGAEVQLDEVELLRSRALVEGIVPLSSKGVRGGFPALPDAGPVPPPAHVAVIMDGNRRWAAQRGLPAVHGHRAGERALVRTAHAAQRLGVRHLTVYLFSTENWNRAQDELEDLFATMAAVISRWTEWLHDRGVRVRWSGRRDRIDPSLASLLALAESMTSNNDVLTLTFCLDYGGRDELAAAARALAAEAVSGAIRVEEIGPDDLARHLYVPELPDVDLLVRTSGEQRISNFLPWQLSYAEFVFDPTPWPDFGPAALRSALAAYAERRRSFGGNAAVVTQRVAAPAAIG